MEQQVNGRVLRLRQGDITNYEADAIVNAANRFLTGGGGVDGAIHWAGGPVIMQECRELGGCEPGDAKATTAGALRARHVIHAVAPIWKGGEQGEAETLQSAYRRALEVADELGDKTIAFPSLGTGAYSYPLPEAAAIAVSTVKEYLRGSTGIEEVTFVLYTPDALAAFRRALWATD